MSDPESTGDAGPAPELEVTPELLSRLRIIEGQPLSARADAYAALHEQLAARLESGPHA
ncbi:hypothetical protein [Microbacterium rhizomatis]|uniref:hypothetical protein n=1 Tax=Microbacterium rhizomatis TaxID=1631477 RepID=UPI0014780BC3|nr:hypothetical protein [Microbacterium rhizomatis]